MHSIPASHPVMSGRLQTRVTAIVVLVTLQFASNMLAGQDTRYAARLTDNRLEVLDRHSGQTIIEPVGRPLVDTRGNADALRPEIEVKSSDSGCELILTFSNLSETPRPLARLRIGRIALGDQIMRREFDGSGEAIPADLQTFGHIVRLYPASMYAPVAVLQNSERAIGLSIQYPILEYRHDVAIGLNNPERPGRSGISQPGWEIDFRLSNLGDENPRIKLNYSALLEPRSTRTYTISIHIEDDPSNWISTLAPYRHFFVRQYGAVRYQRDPRAVLAVSMAVPEAIEPSNPDGWTNSNALRPDRFGWQPWVNAIRAQNGYRRVMCWKFMGNYRESRATPFSFLRQALQHPGLPALFNQDSGLGTLSREGWELGLWWTICLDVMGPGGKVQSFDPENPVHTEAAFAELDLARDGGVSMIGLDTFSHRTTPAWKLYDWLLVLKDRYPDLRFIMEPKSCDFLHTLTPMYYQCRAVFPGEKRPRTPADLLGLNTPHFLADLLVPGHETWGGYRYAERRTYFEHLPPPTAVEVQADLERVARFGLVPCFFTEEPLLRPVRAAETWKTTIHPELHDPSHEPIGDVAHELPVIVEEESAAPPDRPQ